MLELTIPINPVPASRPRVTGRGITYYENPYRTFKGLIKDHLESTFKDKPIDHLVSVDIMCWVEPPAKSKLIVPKPDADNYAKAVLDGMNKLVITDDSLVAPVTCNKAWAAPGQGRIVVRITKSEPKVDRG